jgi:formamidopyrimidine-DNA glycosylase
MPELPEVETVRRSLTDRLVGRAVTGVVVWRADFVTGRLGALAGHRVERLDRRGKELAVVTAGGPVALVHLGMSGTVLWHPAQPLRAQPGAPAGPAGPAGWVPAKHDHAAWCLDDGSRVVFNDPRRFGGLWAFGSFAALEAGRWARLGPDALTIDAGELSRRLGGTSRAVKAALLDQRVLAGVGNIYADEALWLSGIAPRRSARRLGPDDAARLARALREVLAGAVRAGGSTLRDFADAMGRAGGYRGSHAVYGRSGLPCPRCGAPLASTLLAQRTTVWCRACQPASARPTKRGRPKAGASDASSSTP